LGAIPSAVNAVVGKASVSAIRRALPKLHLIRVHRVGHPFSGDEAGLLGQAVVGLVDLGVEFGDIE
jgi:hypothetical protein